ncbi:uncharacterized protein LOC116256965 [Nymphaea colorata]|nr:uncharacterized protein LOC116256965 [Nymphaea colorata]
MNKINRARLFFPLCYLLTPSSFSLSAAIPSTGGSFLPVRQPAITSSLSGDRHWLRSSLPVASRHSMMMISLKALKKIKILVEMEVKRNFDNRVLMWGSGWHTSLFDYRR